jgi:hypothetical protein
LAFLYHLFTIRTAIFVKKIKPQSPLQVNKITAIQQDVGEAIAQEKNNWKKGADEERH